MGGTPVCKFFQQGNCRFGQNCRFEHIYGSKYSYNAGAAAPSQQEAVVKDEQLVNQVVSDVQSALRGGQWLLSCYAPFKEKPIFPGISDLSPEEARLFIYEAKASNNVDQAVAYMNNLFSEARQKHEMLLQKNYNIVSILRSLYKGEPVSSPFGSSAAASVFNGAAQSNSVFNQSSPSIFGQSNSSTPNDPAKSIFAQASQNVFSSNQNSIFSSQQTPPPNQNVFNQQPSVFSQPDTTAKSIFAQATQNPFAQEPPQPSIFAQTPPTNAFTQSPQNTFSQSPPANPASIFASASQSVFNQSAPQTSPFNQNVFHKSDNVQAAGFATNQNVFQQPRAENLDIYSSIDQLAKEDVDAFKCDDFVMGFVPEMPPPHSLCF